MENIKKTAGNKFPLTLTAPKNVGHNITMDMTMDIIMSENFWVIKVLQHNNMHCIGCPLAPFHNVKDAAYEHGLDKYKLLKQLQITSVVKSD